MTRVAIDGPVGAGKSTLARECAKRLGFLYIDTGALYRAVGYYAARNGLDPNDGNSLYEAIKDSLDLRLEIINSTQHVFANGEDVSDKIRTPEISMLASKVSAHPEIRGFLLELQRGIARENSVIMDGRDIGTVILPKAEVKIFLTASPEIRAKRRYDELMEKGENVLYEDVLSELIKRDHADSTRKIAPLKQAEDAVLCDTSGLDFNGAAEKIVTIIHSKA